MKLPKFPKALKKSIAKAERKALAKKKVADRKKEIEKARKYLAQLRSKN